MTQRFEPFLNKTHRIVFFKKKKQMWFKELDFFLKYLSKNLNLIFLKKKKKRWPEELNFDFSWIWRKELDFCWWLKELNLFSKQKMTPTIEPFDNVWLKELNILSADGGRRDVFPFNIGTATNVWFHGLRGISLRASVPCSYVLSKRPGGRQVPRHREAGRRKHGTTMTRRKHGRAASGLASCSLSNPLQFPLAVNSGLPKGRLCSGLTCRQRVDVTLLGWRGHNGYERHDTFNLEENALHVIFTTVRQLGQYPTWDGDWWRWSWKSLNMLWRFTAPTDVISVFEAIWTLVTSPMVVPIKTQIEVARNPCTTRLAIPAPSARLTIW